MNPQPELFEAGVRDADVRSLVEERRERELQLREEAVARMKREHRGWLDRMRAELVRVFEHRVLSWGGAEAYVTADDARALIRSYPDRFGLPAGAHMNLMGALFRARGWARSEARDHTSSTDGSHGNDLYRWRWEGEGQLTVSAGRVA